MNRPCHAGFRHFSIITTIALLIAALVAAFALHPGTDFDASASARSQWIASHVTWWRLGWATVLLAMMLLGGFLTWWALAIRQSAWTPLIIIISVAAVILDAAGIFMFVVHVPQEAEGADRVATILTAGFATALYALAGSLLTWKTTLIPQRLLILAWGGWIGGFTLSLSTFAQFIPGIYAGIVLNWTCLPCICLAIGSHFANRSTPGA
jgi:hypothetical protein